MAPLFLLLLPLLTGAKALGNPYYGYLNSPTDGFESQRFPTKEDYYQDVENLNDRDWPLPQPIPPTKGIYYSLPPPTESPFARRPWDPGYVPGGDQDSDVLEPDQPPHFDRGQPEMEPSLIMPVYHEKRADDDPSSASNVISAPDRGFIEGPIAMARVQQQGKAAAGHGHKEDSMAQLYFVAAIAGCSAAMAVGLVAAGMFWYRMRRSARAAAETAYPAYGVTGPNKTPDLSPTGSISSGDRKLAQSAQMYHYQHQKQQMIAMGTNDGEDRPGAGSDPESEDDHEEEEEGEYTVYECPGLASTGEMEVKNPLFEDQPTPLPPPDEQ